MVRRPLWILVAGLALFGTAVVAPAANAAPPPPVFVSMFDGKTLDGWTQSNAGGYSVVGGAIHTNGTARGWASYNKAR